MHQQMKMAEFTKTLFMDDERAGDLNSYHLHMSQNLITFDFCFQPLKNPSESTGQRIASSQSDLTCVSDCMCWEVKLPFTTKKTKYNFSSSLPPPSGFCLQNEQTTLQSLNEKFKKYVFQDGVKTKSRSTC